VNPILVPGRKFELTQATLAIMLVSGRRLARYLPVGAILTVLPTYQRGDKSIEVAWERQAVTMFAVDLEVRGRLIAEGFPTSAERKKSVPSS
jgi:hypothetical protein